MEISQTNFWILGQSQIQPKYVYLMHNLDWAPGLPYLEYLEINGYFSDIQQIIEQTF